MRAFLFHILYLLFDSADDRSDPEWDR